jgi:hypothetical protein
MKFKVLFLITFLTFGSYFISSCSNNDQFYVQPAPPYSPPAETTDIPINNSTSLPLPGPMKYPLPKAVASEKQCWENRDLRFLKGCWTLGQDRLMTCYAGSTPTPCTLSALSVCFNEKGQSTKSLFTFKMLGSNHDCSPPEVAAFDAQGHVVIHNTNMVYCTGSFHYNVMGQYTCTYKGEGLADCIYHVLNQTNHPDHGSHVFLKRTGETGPVGCAKKL